MSGCCQPHVHRRLFKHIGIGLQIFQIKNPHLIGEWFRRRRDPIKIIAGRRIGHVHKRCLLQLCKLPLQRPAIQKRSERAVRPGDILPDVMKLDAPEDTVCRWRSADHQELLMASPKDQPVLPRIGHSITLLCFRECLAFRCLSLPQIQLPVLLRLLSAVQQIPQL